MMENHLTEQLSDEEQEAYEDLVTGAMRYIYPENMQDKLVQVFQSSTVNPTETLVNQAVRLVQVEC